MDDAAKGGITLNIDSNCPLDDNVKAHHYMEDNRAKGKIVTAV
ncbi:zinc-binding dehydrogenase [Sediminicola sp. 1XM1-17]